jgi:uncharacterized membrane protein
MKRIDTTIGRIMQLGTLIAFIIVITGGLYYLLKHSQDIISFQTLQKQPDSSLPRSIIQLGLICLVFVQMLRVALTLWYFKTLKDKFFALLSLLILIVMITNFIWPL